MKINVLVSFDEKYAPMTGVMLSSLFKTNKHYSFNIYAFIECTCSNRVIRKFESFVKNENADILIFMLSEQSLLAECPINMHTQISTPTYYRLLAPSILPKDVHKILYLDGDIIINGDIGELWSTDLTDKAFAGVEDCCTPSDDCERLGYSSEYGYYNAGVSLYNLDYWREHNLSLKAFSYIQDHPSSLTWMDQDVVNCLFHELRVCLPYSYNFQTFFFAKENWEKYSDEQRNSILSFSKNPLAIHYIGKVKPWDRQYYGCPYNFLWWKNALRSTWRKYFIQPNIADFVRFCFSLLIHKRKHLAYRDYQFIIKALSFNKVVTNELLEY